MLGIIAMAAGVTAMPSIAASAIGDASANAPEVSSAQIDHAILDNFKLWSELAKDPERAPTIPDLMYWPNAIVTGEGVAHTMVGLDQIKAYFKPMLKGTLNLTFRIREPSIASGPLTVTMANVDIHPSPGQPEMTASAVMVWERRGTEWKIIREVMRNNAID